MYEDIDTDPSLSLRHIENNPVMADGTIIAIAYLGVGMMGPRKREIALSFNSAAPRFHQ